MTTETWFCRMSKEYNWSEIFSEIENKAKKAKTIKEKKLIAQLYYLLVYCADQVRDDILDDLQQLLGSGVGLKKPTKHIRRLLSDILKDVRVSTLPMALRHFLLAPPTFTELLNRNCFSMKSRKSSRQVLFN